ncbi:MAG: metallophosphoesterase family protein [bacterium]|jgi:exonuclease SbcD
MPTVKILQTGDLHLETPFTDCGLPAGLAGQRRSELRGAFARIIEVARENGVEVLLLTGDLFEHRYATKDVIRFVNGLLAEIPDTRVFIAPGNHDPALPDSYYRTFPWAGNVHIFREPSFAGVAVPELGAVVYGYGWTQWEIRQRILPEMKITDPDAVNIVLLHGDVVGRSGESVYLPVTQEDLATSMADYIALGHIHGCRSYEAGGKLLAQYAGSPEPLNAGETGRHGILLGEVGKGGSDWDFVPVAKRRYFTLDVSIDPEMDTAKIAAVCREMIRENGGPEDIFRFILTGRYDPESRFDSVLWREALSGACGHAELTDRTQPDYDLTELARQENTVLGQFVKAMQRQMMEVAEDEKAVVEKALIYGLDALTGQKVVGR